MKRGILSYSITWNQNGEKHEEILFSKLSVIKAYVDMLTRHWNTAYHNDGISALRLWDIRRNGTTEDITEKVNKFLYN